MGRAPHLLLWQVRRNSLGRFSFGFMCNFLGIIALFNVFKSQSFSTAPLN
ncbi:unnamed protein product [Amoebophrya sp. A25]|nr:unnamed protein product [Amoebophrya sp. A25]|eukprot:GSA25T00023727001.1